MKAAISRGRGGRKRSRRLGGGWHNPRQPPPSTVSIAHPKGMRCPAALLGPNLQGRRWRPEAESNRCTRICSPLHSHSAIRPAGTSRYRRAAISWSSIGAQSQLPRMMSYHRCSIGCAKIAPGADFTGGCGPRALKTSHSLLAAGSDGVFSVDCRRARKNSGERPAA
jgi:hypothetical protein